jgi:hypothetical protein
MDESESKRGTISDRDYFEKYIELCEKTIYAKMDAGDTKALDAVQTLKDEYDKSEIVTKTQLDAALGSIKAWLYAIIVILALIIGEMVREYFEFKR